MSHYLKAIKKEQQCPEQSMIDHRAIFSLSQMVQTKSASEIQTAACRERVEWSDSDVYGTGIKKRERCRPLIFPQFNHCPSGPA